MSLLHLESLKALATATARAAKTSSLTQFRVFPNFLKINPATMEFRIKRNFFWSVILGHPTQLYKTGHKEISRRSRAVVTAKKQSEKVIHVQSWYLLYQTFASHDVLNILVKHEQGENLTWAACYRRENIHRPEVFVYLLIIDESNGLCPIRERLRHEKILSSLAGNITTSHQIYPSFGTAEFFEFVLRNPYSTDQNVSIICDDQELKYVLLLACYMHIVVS